MKKHSLICLGILVLTIIQCGNTGFAQDNDVLLRAMNDELQRNISRLTLEGVSKPFYISYQVKDKSGVNIQATAGAITRFDTSRHRVKDVRVLVGDYKQTQEQFLSMDMSFSYQGSANTLPIENDYDAIRRGLWLSTDRAYKSATEKYEKKQAAIQQQQIADDIKDLPDFTKGTPARHIEEIPSVKVDAGDWPERIERLSGLFNNYPDIYLSSATISINITAMYFVNSEGTVLRKARTLVSFLATAATQAGDGETLDDFVIHHVKDLADIPSEKELAQEIKAMAELLTAKRNAPPMKETYTGPVLFEDQAAAELFTRLYLGDEGLIASRMPVMDGPLAMMGAQMQKRNLGDKLNKRVLPKAFSIWSVPAKREFEGTELIGHFVHDAEGVSPAERLALVKGGKVTALLADRTPTPHTASSTGHRAMAIGTGTDGISPGVLEVMVDEGPSLNEVKGLLLEKASDEGLEYAYIVRRIRPETVSPPSLDDNFSFSFSMMQGSGDGQTPIGDAVQLFRVRVSDGSETAVRSAEVLKPGASALRRLEATSERKAWNITCDGEDSVPGFGAFLSIGRSIAGAFGGIPTTLITPRAVLIDEMEIRENKRAYTPKPPIVQSPLVR